MNIYNILHRFKVSVSIILLTLLVNVDVNATDINKNKAFAGFIKHIYDNINTLRGGKNFCIFGSDEISFRLKSIVNKDFEDLGEEINKSRNYSNCKVIYIAKSKEKEARYSVEYFNKVGSLTIAVFPNFISDGGMMSVDIGRRNFEILINDVALKEFGVRIDSSIAALIVE